MHIKDVVLDSKSLPNGDVEEHYLSESLIPEWHEGIGWLRTKRVVVERIRTIHNNDEDIVI
jgi:hypothetical protein